jgi:hypothetical protein
MSAKTIPFEQVKADLLADRWLSSNAWPTP